MTVNGQPILALVAVQAVILGLGLFAWFMGRNNPG